VPPDEGTTPGETLKHAVFAQHRRLDAMFEELLAGLRSGGPPEASRGALKELRTALEAHFDQEDQLYYPTIWTLRSDLKPQLEPMVDAHRDFKAKLDRLAGLWARGGLAEGLTLFEDLATAFQRHEQDEEEILAALDLELGASR